jgi:6-phosphogluconate dehydrogenase
MTRTLGLVGLGKMGGNMARRLSRAGVRVVGYDVNTEAMHGLQAEGALTAADSLAALVAALPEPAGERVVWTMLPSGDISQTALTTLLPLLAKGDLLIDGANANYKHSQARGAWLAEQGIGFMDCGVSGGVHGLANGYCLMFGGSEADAARAKPIMQALAAAPDRGWLHCGPVGAGHYTKMIHNGIEYGMMQAIAEGFSLLDAKKEFELPTAQIAELWKSGSVVRSWLLDLTAEALQDPSKMQAVAPFVSDSGEGRWTVDAAVEQGVAAPVLALALMMRFASQGKDEYAAKLLALMRQGFGGHAVKSSG